MKSYKDLEISNLSYELAVKVYKVTMTLPNFELYEEGSQVRRPSKSISSNISEGYGRNKYKADFIRFLIYAHASCDETLIHLSFIRDTHDSIQDMADLMEGYENLGRKINSFISYVEQNWRA